MILQEMLKTADIEKICTIWKKTYFSSSEDKWSELKKEILKFCDMFCSLRIEDKNEEDIFVAHKYFEDGNSFIYAVLYKKQELKEAMPAIMKIDFPQVISETETSDYFAEVIRKYAEPLPISYDFTFSPWEDIIGTEVEIHSVEKYGKEEFLASALHEMSFNGFSHESQEERRKELDDAIARIEETEKFFNEKKSFETVREILDEYADFSISMEEIEEGIRNSRLDAVKFVLQKIKDLQEIGEIS